MTKKKTPISDDTIEEIVSPRAEQPAPGGEPTAGGGAEAGAISAQAPPPQLTPEQIDELVQGRVAEALAKERPLIIQGLKEAFPEIVKNTIQEMIQKQQADTSPAPASTWTPSAPPPPPAGGAQPSGLPADSNLLGALMQFVQPRNPADDTLRTIGGQLLQNMAAQMAQPQQQPSVLDLYKAQQQGFENAIHLITALTRRKAPGVPSLEGFEIGLEGEPP